MRLNETYESFIELKQLASDIDSMGAEIVDYDIYTLSDFVKREYTILRDFVNDLDIGVMTFNLKSKDMRGAWVQPSEYEKLAISIDKDKDIQIKKYSSILQYAKGIIVIDSKSWCEEVILHELEHAWDDFRANGKITSTKIGSKLMNQLKKGKKTQTQYYRTPHEMSAYFIQAISKLGFYMDNSHTIMRSIQDVYDDFKTEYQGYELLTPRDKKILARKFSQYYHKMKEQPMKEMKIITLEDFINEDFYNPFDEKEPDMSPKLMADKGGLLKVRKETFNINRVEYTKRTNGKYTVISKDMIAKGEVVEICPVIMCGIESKAIDGVKDLIFEIDRNLQQYGLVLGYGSLYQHSENPNMQFGYNKGNKQMYFTATRMIKAGEELTINYGKEYWDERKNFNTMAPLPEPDKIIQPENEGAGLQQPIADITNDIRTKQFSAPMNPANPVVSGKAILGGGQA